MNTEWSKPTKYIVGVGLFLLGVFILYISRSILPLLVIAALIAVIVRPMIMGLHVRGHLPRGAAVAIVYLGLLVLLPLAVLIAIPAIVDAVDYVLNLDYQSILEGTIVWLETNLTSLKDAQLPIGGLDEYIDQTADALLAELAQEAAAEVPPEPPSIGTILRSFGSAVTTTFRTAASLAGAVFTRLALFLFTFLASVYISLSAHTYQENFLRVVPAAYRPEVSILLARIGRMWGAFFRGQITLMFVIGLFSWLGLTILGVPGALSLGIVAGLLELIPNLGPIIATIPAVIVALLQGSSYLPVSNLTLALIVVIFYVVLQQFENNVIVPRILGEAVELPPLIVMSGVLVGAEFAGLLGALLASPVIATLREIVRYLYRKMQGEDPFPPKEALPAAATAYEVQAKKTLRQTLRGWLNRLQRPKPRPRQRPAPNRKVKQD